MVVPAGTTPAPRGGNTAATGQLELSGDGPAGSGLSGGGLGAAPGTGAGLPQPSRLPR